MRAYFGGDAFDRAEGLLAGTLPDLQRAFDVYYVPREVGVAASVP